MLKTDNKMPLRLFATYTGATEVAGPGSAERAGKGVAAHCDESWSSAWSSCEKFQHNKGTYSSLNVSETLASGELSSGRLGLRGDGDDVGAVGERTDVVSKNGHLSHDSLELGNHGVVVGC